MAGAWKVILPEAATNKVLSPVAQGALTTTYALVGTPTITLPTTAGYAYSGYKHYDVVTDADNEGISLVLSALANAIHYVTVRTYGAPTAAWDWSLDGANFNIPTLLGYEGNFYVYGYQFTAAQSNGSVSLKIQTRGVSVNHFVISHVQVEQNTYATTPITGDMKGFKSDGYYWNGSPHASSSTRSAQERNGGLEVDLQDTYNFVVQFGVGKGMPPVTHHTQGMALLPGALYAGHKVEPRVLDLISTTVESTIPTIAAARKNFINAIKLDRVSPDQPVVFRYYGNTAKPVEFHGVYDSGMESQQTSGRGEQAVARFICYDPFAYETHTESAALTTSQSVADADYIVRKVSGTWYNINTGFDASAEAIVRGNDGCLYIGGDFTTTGLADHDHYIVKWDPYTGTRSVLGTGMNGNVYALAVAPNGDIYAGGAFASAGGVANTSKIAYWDISASAWVSVSATNPNADVYELEFDQTGNLYVGGAFTNLGDANGDYIVKWTGAAWASLGTGMNGNVWGLSVAADNSIYVAGEFTTGNGVTLNGIGKWNGTTFVAMGAGLSGGVSHGEVLAVDAAGNVYVGGNFTSADGVACNYIAKWNGKTFEPLGSGLDNYAQALVLNDGLLHVGGAFTVAGGLALADRYAIWNETTWAYPDINLPGAPVVSSICFSNNGVYVGYNTSGTATSSYLNAVTNNGSTTAYPVINIHRAEDGTTAVLEWIKNETTGDTLWCNYSLLKGETLTIDLTPGNRSITSSYFGDVWRAVLRSSDLSSFNLLPGANNISVFVNPTGAPTITAWLEYPITHWGADMVAA